MHGGAMNYAPRRRWSFEDLLTRQLLELSGGVAVRLERVVRCLPSSHLFEAFVDCQEARNDGLADFLKLLV